MRVWQPPLHLIRAAAAAHLQRAEDGPCNHAIIKDTVLPELPPPASAAMAPPLPYGRHHQQHGGNDNHGYSYRWQQGPTPPHEGLRGSSSSALLVVQRNNMAAGCRFA